MLRPRSVYNFTIVYLLLCLLLNACRASSPLPLPQSPRAQELRTRGKLIIGTALTAPFIYHDPQTGAYIGHDVAIAEAIAAHIGVPIEWREMAFADLLPSLQAGQIDLVIAAMYITDERSEIALFSDGYVDTGLAMVIRQGDPDITAPNELAGRIIGVKESATGHRFAHRLQNDGISLSVRAYANTQDSLEDLSAGYVDVVFNDYVNTLLYIKTHPDLRVIDLILEPAQLGIAVQQGDTGLLALVNEVLAQLRTTGMLDTLYQQWIEAP